MLAAPRAGLLSDTSDFTIQHSEIQGIIRERGLGRHGMNPRVAAGIQLSRNPELYERGVAPE